MRVVIAKARRAREATGEMPRIMPASHHIGESLAHHYSVKHFDARHYAELRVKASVIAAFSRSGHARKHYFRQLLRIGDGVAMTV